jgi:hypothetical protein
MLLDEENMMTKEEEIKLIAYSIWESEGCPNGLEWEHWFIAQNIWEEQQKKKTVDTP